MNEPVGADRERHRVRAGDRRRLKHGQGEQLSGVDSDPVDRRDGKGVEPPGSRRRRAGQRRRPIAVVDEGDAGRQSGRSIRESGQRPGSQDPLSP